MFKRLFGLVAALLFASIVHAQAVPATDPIPRVAFPMTHVGNVSTIGPRTADAANAAKFSFGVASNGAIFANTGDRLPTPGGASIPIGVNGTIAKPNVAAALGRFARKALPLVSTGFALYDLGEELGFGLDNSSGSMVVSKPDPTACAANCYTYTGQVGDIPLSSPSIGSYAAAYVSGANSFPPPMYRHLLLSTDAANHRFYVRRTYVGYGGEEPWNYDEVWITPTRTPRSPDQASSIPSSVDEFVEAVAARSSWPSSSALARATVDAIRSGEALEVVPTSVTGPATSPGPASTSYDVTNNTTTISAATHNHTYAGPQVSTTTVTNISTVNNATQEVISEREVVDTPVTPEKAAEPPCGGPGMPPCNVKVDETGTPPESSAPGRFATAGAGVDEQKGILDGLFDTIESWTIGGWTWTFAFPTGCTPMTIDILGEVEVDPCRWQSQIHGLMSIIWVLTGICAAFVIFERGAA